MKLEDELKNLIVAKLKLEGVAPEDIADDAPLLGEGLGLDSLDAVELVMLLHKHYQVDIKDADEARKAFVSIKVLAETIRSRKGQT